VGVYNTVKPPALAIGQQYVLSNASLGGSNVLSQQVAPAQMPGNPTNLTLINLSAATLTVYVSATDANSASYVSLGVTCGPNSAVSFSTTAPFVAVSAATDPSTGVITLCR
jgi:hypothetical protein